ncbi:zinc-binding dehydrogenase [Domibacillus sp. DTU_2020_1001157_1_SI_ALB_TIR_016]|uniref:zinc-dependent alcohol dehydrogenase family protein n=1 Tax=Domibacillus sp. DTU_2020_1001157_1_SI_ALB_TIR_016 TaxID=3077789 RepID=UPI0028E42DD6|nr:zinc-binding dehydrogenase [Domibacillus sp. DTU_2020_1001157_1_SI_ALB_TIR_016]WNS79603.1 zinc-binding dehydrogenase [Domibacillus sp. DTU_2020_1001157_1_SI_ALB_TIR_016]
MTMRAVIFPGEKKVEIQQVDIPTPGLGEVLIQLKASAICRSDMSLYYGTSVFGDGNKKASIIPGHEPAGIITEVGDGVTTHKVGDRVAVYLALGCGECAHCKSGYKMFCKEFKCIGFDAHGGDADYMVAPAENCMRLPDDMNFVTAAVSTDAVGTLYHAQKRLNISGRDTLVMFGLGPMGNAGVMIAKGLGATVIAVDMLDERLEMAKELGADYTINGKDANVLEEIARITNGQGADAAIDCSGSPYAENDALSCVRPHGRVAFIGESKETTIKPSEQLIRKQITVMGSWYFPIHEYDEIADFIVKKKLPVKKLVTHIFPLTEAETAFRLFDERKTEKAVFVWE